MKTPEPRGPARTLTNHDGTNRHTRRAGRKRAITGIRTLYKMSDAPWEFDALLRGAGDRSPDEQRALMQLAYAAEKAGRISRRNAEYFGCKFAKGHK